MELSPSRPSILLFLDCLNTIKQAAHIVQGSSQLLLLLLCPKLFIVTDCLQICPYPLYAALSSTKQVEVLKPPPKSCRKVIFSTNIAETSITIPGIKYVVDTGMVKAKIIKSSKNLKSSSMAANWQSRTSIKRCLLSTVH
ncbi:pre-mRNA-splicing factor ATP-dependent RNA helicase DEAH10-like [Centruroides sculpturatus]|uniref:pre-mRNA-splicing factor ATP-dependent RNA helicase DEAH10-like n=1 Tax=Centruroides sculpturatus TaxID=218467 RepID=UPI000C6EBB58|nr:pre-mRNA-splicing factor ATP-dependent RNA helicase DEAH10-like [Centruroides sculpturatus]